MTASTVYEVFLALPSEEKEKFIVLVTEEKSKTSIDFKKGKTQKDTFTQQDAVDYLLATVFKSKN
ncbi:MAG TPA: hypothetical protein VLZ11_00995 [Flavobacterium sp.]|nr:hypothetical protein [Flavobacterium sp.]